MKELEGQDVNHEIVVSECEEHLECFGKSISKSTLLVQYGSEKGSLQMSVGKIIPD